jgi:hypothetical protein
MKNLLIWAVVLGLVGYGGAKLYLHNEVSDAMDMAVMMMSPYASVQYDGVASTMTGELTVEGVTFRVKGFRDEVYIDSIGIDTPSFLSLLELSDLVSMQGDSVPEHIAFIVDGLRIPANADYYDTLYQAKLEEHGATDATDAAVECAGKYGFSPTALAGLGYRDQTFSMSMSVRDLGSTYSLGLAVNIQDMWDIDANIGLAGNMMTDMSKGAQYRPRLQQLSLDFVDRSLNERVREYCAKRGLTPEETFKAQMDAFKYSGEYNGIVFDEYMLDPYQEFLEGKSTLSVTARPTEPIAFSQIDLYKPTDVPALLNLEASAR